MKPAIPYKPSNTFSFVGFILMFISMLITGALLSWLYVILQAVIPIIYLCILITIGFGAAIGAIGMIFVKTYKIRHPVMAMIATLIAMLFVYLFHWCVYVARDYDKNIYDYMKLQTASGFFFEATDEEVSDEDNIAYMVYDMQSNPTKWKKDNMDKLLGTTEEEIRTSMKAMVGKNAYSFYYEYRNQPTHNIGYLLTHPSDLWDDICNINKTGRWSMGSRHSYSSTTNKTPVTGVILWLTWIGEMLLMFIPAMAIVYARATSPFIESDNDWAITDKPQFNFKFVDPFPGNNRGSDQFKSVFRANTESLFTLQPLLAQMGVMNTYYTATYCHSKYYTENYLTVNYTKVSNAKNNQRVNVSIAKNVRVDADFIATLHGMFGYPVPPACPGVNKYAQQPQQDAAQQQEAPQQQYQQQAYAQQQTAPQQQYQQQAYAQQQAAPQQQYQQQAYAQQQAAPQQQYQQQAYAQQQAAPQQQYQQQAYAQQQAAPQQQAPSENWGEMDGIDTSNIDLTSLNNMK